MTPGMRGKARCSCRLRERVGSGNAPISRPSGESHGTALAGMHRNLFHVKMALAKIIQGPVCGSKPNNPFRYISLPRTDKEGRVSSFPCNLLKELQLPDFSQRVI